MTKALLWALPGAVLATGAGAVEVLESAFQLALTQNGETTYTDTTTIPLLPEEACYYWYLRLAKVKGDVTFTETYLLPGAPADWGDTGTVNDAATTVSIAEDGMSSTRVETQTPDDGWISHGWCVLEGDPLGQHHIDVSIDDEVIWSVDFELVQPGKNKAVSIPDDAA